jgi:hypothetical protein
VRRGDIRFRVRESAGIPSVSTGFARPVQEDSPHLSEFPEGIMAKVGGCYAMPPG